MEGKFQTFLATFQLIIWDHFCMIKIPSSGPLYTDACQQIYSFQLLLREADTEGPANGENERKVIC